ncbi:uncharacterized protein EI90DRAFT_3157815 [Cantharellus anzutake]|uniref:uncharacterized protein n=1 Tax=Cantharellus anzutake TaxID=1750568 RepID=UPI001909052F|nr:uncharacterized protein EI90DRAFT_3157815 [Cantharellus anzutake]KAF8321995.1 hypothetical protein EI90DRAFT_3157815 [Cantharellus anzutake]
MTMNYYEALEVPSTASADTIKHQYKHLARIWHPDKNRGNAAASERFKLISEAYEILIDSAKRSAYDLAQHQGSKISKPITTLPARACPKNNFVVWPSATWYELSAAPGVSFCSFCYEEHIAATRFSQAFREISALPPHPMNCGYWAPRVRLLFEGVLKSGDLSALIAHLEIRASIPDCLGAEDYVPGPEPRMEWFSLKANLNSPSGPLSGFIVCRACYEDIVMATPHHIHFRKYWRTQLPDQVWSCDVGREWGRFVFDPFVPNNRDLGWNAVVKKLASEFGKECYEKSGDRSGAWWRLRGDLDDNSLAVCGPCYASHIAPSDRATDFKSLSSSELPFSPSDQDQPFLSCAMGDYRLRMAWDIVKFLGLTTSIWCNVALVILHCDPCTSEGGIGRKWYRITSFPSLCNICPGCYYAMFYTFGFGPHFSPYRDTVDPDIEADSQRRVCDLNPSQPRFLQLLRKIDEAGAVGNFDILLQYTQERADLPPCPLMLPADDSESRIWYGNGNSFVACEECYFDLIRTSPLAQYVMQCDPRNSPQFGFCALSSDRMRRQWANACQCGDPTEFLELCEDRASVFEETVLKARRLKLEIEEREQEAINRVTLGYHYYGDSYDGQFEETKEETATMKALYRRWAGWY